MGAILDLIGSYVFKAAMIGIILSTSISLNNVMVEKSQLTNLEKNVNVAMSVVEWDLMNIGYNYSGTAFLTAQSADLRYYADVQNDGTADIVRYFLTSSYVSLGDSTVLRYSLTRTVNGTGNVIMSRIISYQMQYIDRNGATTAVLGSIKGVRISVYAESPILVDGHALRVQRTFMIFPANLALKW